MLCPNDCQDPPLAVTVVVDPCEFLHVVHEGYTERDGIADVAVLPEGTPPKLRLHINQAAYETMNYFYGRRYLEDSPATVSDIEDGIVLVEFDCVLGVVGHKCVNCGTIAHPLLDDLSQHEEFEPDEAQEWLVAEHV